MSFKKKYAKIIFTVAVFSACIYSYSCKSQPDKASPENTRSEEIARDTEFFVSSFAPEGVIPAAVNYPSIQIQFSEPVIPLAKLGEPMTTTDVVKITPALKGVFRWYGTGLLSFDCEEPLIPQKLYSAKINTNIKSIHGTSLSGQTEFTFHTEEIRLTGIETGYTSRTEKKLSFNQNDIPPEYATDIALTFSNNVNPDVISKFISIKSKSANKSSSKKYDFTAKKLPQHLHSQNGEVEQKRILLTPTEKFENDAEIEITLLKGAVPDTDCYATSKNQSLTFHTLRPLEFTGANGTSTLSISFNHRLDEKSLEKIANAISFSPAFFQSTSQATTTATNVLRENISISYNSIVIKDVPVSYGDSYSFTIDANCVTDIYGQVYAKKIEEKIEVPDADNFANFKNSDFQILESEFTPQIAFEHQNIISGSYTLTHLSGVTSNYNSDKKITVELPSSANKNDTNLNRRVIESVSLSPALEKIPSGQFRGAVKFEAQVKTKNTSSYSSWRNDDKEAVETSTTQFIQVTDLGMTFRHAYNKIVVLVSKLSDGTPVAGANVSVISTRADTEDIYEMYTALLSGDTTKKITAVTDDDGLAVIELNGKINDIYPSQNYWLEAMTKDDRVVTSTQNYFPYYKPMKSTAPIAKPTISETTTTENTNTPRRAVIFMYADRGLYKPGETATIKIIDRELTAGSYGTFTGNYEITFTNSTWRGPRTIYKTEHGTMSRNGTCTVTWALPDDLPPGNYYVTYTRKDGSNESYNYAINVQFFERLRFQAVSSIPEIAYFRGDNVSAEISASYLGGGTLAGADINADWSRDAVYFAPQGKQLENMTFGPLQDWHYYRSFYENADEYENDNFHKHTAATLSADGKARISVATGSEKKSGSAYKYFLEAQVTDAGNQMIATRASTIVHPASFYIGLSRPKNFKSFPKKNESIEFETAIVTPEGEYPDTALLPTDKILSYELSREIWEEIETTDEFGYIQHEWKRRNETEATGKIQMPHAKKIDSTLGRNSTTNDTANSTDNSKIIPLAKFSVTPKNGGSYTLTLRTKDAQNRDVITQETFFVSGSDWTRSPNRDASVIELTTDKERYDVGDTAHISMSTSLEKGRYLLTIEREGIISERVFTLHEQSSVIDIPVDEKYLPIAYITISSFTHRNGETANDYDTRDEHKPVAVAGSTALHISPKTRTFDIKIFTDKSSYTPGSNARIEVSATKDGTPIQNAEITLMAVDRGVLDLIDYHVQNPLEYFYDESNFQSGTSGDDSRNRLVDPVTYGTYTMSAKERATIFYDRLYKNTAMSTASMAAPEAAMMDMKAVAEATEMDSDDSNSTPQIRKDFRTTAVFITMTTDENGKVNTMFKLPDSLTEYRITAIGLHENKFAFVETPLIAANPISVRSVEPRLLRPGDIGETGVVITNIGDTAERITVQLDVFEGVERTGYKSQQEDMPPASGRAEVIGVPQKTVTVSNGETATVMFEIRALSEGWITLGFHATTGNASSAATSSNTTKNTTSGIGASASASSALNEIIYKPLEIEKPYIYETVTTVGEVAQDESYAEERIILPSKIDDGKGSLFIQLDANRLGTLTSAIDYVFHYPYGCLEQRSSAIMPLISFGKYISVFGLESEVSDPFKVVEKEIASWASFQKQDGGFPYWRDSNYSSFATSLRIAEIIALAKEHGVKISESIDIAKLCNYIECEVAALDATEYNSYPSAYSYYVLAKLGRAVSSSKLSKIVSDNECGISEYAFIGLAALQKNETSIAKQAATQIKNRMSLTPRGASFQTGTPHFSWFYYNGNAERYALALSLFTQLGTNDVYVSHIVYELLEMQKTGQGKWQSTATTSRVLMAIETYIKTYSLDDTDFTAKVLIGSDDDIDIEEEEKIFVRGKFSGANAKPVNRTAQFDEPTLSSVQRDKELPLTFKKDGQGTLYYTLSMRYALPAAEQKARDEGICLYTEITDARTGERVTGDKLESGKIYRQKIFVSTPKERRFVALRAPVPAGAEILNPAFSTTATVPLAPNEISNTSNAQAKRIQQMYHGMTHQDIYNAEIQCFWDYMPQGLQEIEFTFRATRKGSYNTPSAQAECMYESEIFGRTSGKLWQIE